MLSSYEEPVLRLCNFSTEDKIKFLKKHEYKVTLEKIDMWRSAYHNTTEDFTSEVYVVKNYIGKDYPYKPGGSYFEKEEWLNLAFKKLLKEKLLNL